MSDIDKKQTLLYLISLTEFASPFIIHHHQA